MRSVFLLALFCVIFAARARGDDLSTIRATAAAYHTLANAPANDPTVAGEVAKLDASITSMLSSLQMDGSFDDIVYFKSSGALVQPTGAWSPITHFDRLWSMAQAYSMPASSYYASSTLFASIGSALAYAEGLYCAPGDPSPAPPACSLAQGNWWFWQIGVPLQLGPTLFLLTQANPDPSAALDAGVLAQLIHDLQGQLAAQLTGVVGSRVGENLAWSALNRLYLALVDGDATLLSQASADMGSTCLPVASVGPTGGGILTDDSFQQHGPQLATGGYGGDFADTASLFSYLTAGTGVALSADAQQGLESFVAFGIRWALYGDYFDVSSVGRGIAQPGIDGFSGLSALLRLSFVPSSVQSRLAEAAGAMLQSWLSTGMNFASDLPIAGLVAPEMALDAGTTWVAGEKGYRDSDYVVHRRSSYFESVKMISSRTVGGEYTNDEDLQGARQSDGRLYLVLNGSQYMTNDVLPTLDWSRLPGITVEQSPHVVDAGFEYGTESFVGEVNDGLNGVAGMNFAAVGSSLTALKSWFFFDDSTVFLASNIACPSSYEVETVVQQWPLSGAREEVIVDGMPFSADGGAQVLSGVSWIASDGLGYYFPGQPAVDVKVATESGSWTDINGEAGVDPTVYSNPFLTIWFDHGPGDALNTTSAAYEILPGVDAGMTAAWATSSPLQILENDGTAAAVRDQRSGTLEVLFWSAPASVEVAGAPLASVATDTPCLVVIDDDGGPNVALAVADPDQSTGTLTLLLGAGLSSADPSADADAGIAISPWDGGTQISVPFTGGYTVRTVLVRNEFVPGGTTGTAFGSGATSGASTGIATASTSGSGTTGSATGGTTVGAGTTSGSSTMSGADIGTTTGAGKPGKLVSKSGCGCAADGQADLLLAALGMSMLLRRRKP